VSANVTPKELVERKGLDGPGFRARNVADLAYMLDCLELMCSLGSAHRLSEDPMSRLVRGALSVALETFN
jgi:hypothetical protein